MLSTKSGFSVMEVMVVMGLASVILFGVAQLTQRTLETQKFLRKKSEAIQSATLGCERLASEMREAVTAPSTGSTSSWQKVIPSQAEVMGIPAPVTGVVPSSPGWPRAYQSDQLITVTYSVTDSKLQRQATGSVASPVATDVNTFDVTAVSGREKTFLVRLAVAEQKRVQTFVAQVFCPGVP